MTSPAPGAPLLQRDRALDRNDVDAVEVVARRPALEKRSQQLLLLAQKHRFNVRLADSNSLPRFELKAKRLVDKRPTAEFT